MKKNPLKKKFTRTALEAKAAASALGTSTAPTRASTTAALGDYEPADSDAEHGRS